MNGRNQLKHLFCRTLVSRLSKRDPRISGSRYQDTSHHTIEGVSNFLRPNFAI